jgi:hypothetical protein
LIEESDEGHAANQVDAGRVAKGNDGWWDLGVYLIESAK